MLHGAIHLGAETSLSFQVKYKIPREGKRNFCYSCRFKIRESFAFKDLFLFEFIMTSIASQGEKLLSLKIFIIMKVAD